MEAIRVLEKTGKDGTLLLRIPLGRPDVEYDVVVIAHPKDESATAAEPQGGGWPPGYFDLAGSIADESFIRHPQGELSKPVNLE